MVEILPSFGFYISEVTLIFMRSYVYCFGFNPLRLPLNLPHVGYNRPEHSWHQGSLAFVFAAL
jgi:hypothetical protein